MLPSNIELQVLLNGNLVRGLLRASISTTNCFSADTFSITFALGPDASGDSGFWSEVTSAYLEISAFVSRQPPSQTLITGMVDTIHVDPIHGTVGIDGRDMSASLIDSYRQQDFVNHTASEIDTSIAQSHGLQPVVTSTQGITGRYYNDGYTKLSIGQFSRLQSDWDLLVQLARQNSFDIFVQGKSLFFQPSGVADASAVFLAPSDILRMRIERNLAIIANRAATVQSWNSQRMTAYQSNQGVSTVATNSESDVARLPFLFLASNLTPQQVADSAERYSSELGRLGSTLHIDMPWRLTMSPRVLIAFNGTNSGFDTTYQIDSIERHYCSTSGSMQIISATQFPAQSS